MIFKQFPYEFLYLHSDRSNRCGRWSVFKWNCFFFTFFFFLTIGKIFFFSFFFFQMSKKFKQQIWWIILLLSENGSKWKTILRLLKLNCINFWIVNQLKYTKKRNNELALLHIDRFLNKTNKKKTNLILATALKYILALISHLFFVHWFHSFFDRFSNENRLQQMESYDVNKTQMQISIWYLFCNNHFISNIHFCSN